MRFLDCIAVNFGMLTHVFILGFSGKGAMWKLLFSEWSICHTMRDVWKGNEV